MIAWTRWGLLVVVALIVGAILGSATLSALGNAQESPLALAMMFWYGALISLALTRWVFPRLDKPRQVAFTRPLAQPIVDSKGRRHKFETVPALDPEGEPMYYTPTSTLFYIPARFYWMIFAVCSLPSTAQWIFSG